MRQFNAQLPGFSGQAFDSKRFAPEDIANSFDKYVSKVVPTLHIPCPTLHGDSHSADQFTYTHAAPMFDPPLVRADEIESAISKLKSSASPGPDGIFPPLLKACASALSLPVYNLYNYKKEEEAPLVPPPPSLSKPLSYGTPCQFDARRAQGVAEFKDLVRYRDV
ncbi:hypothetical protein HPB47_005165 [Ixodes persulcatus]|uniref:Uncharacterized protein n=1 Tax=Ixodes persulcatus TaxID=34615 RepID=A0AC60PDU9_IXOPE|nr:hypothetical protein HPB47_005165 [Ixodes persulcatus]